ncbi:hypothetical protein [Oceanicoccus sp. KOV_DT_Chl]|uniref:oxidoreductase n=1 Tax=Oceanicoccus sp. KOV_DT_Chl TaxID=1904639 RepID=UPI00190E60B2|nr:hypothetical protein [Oceanicoccus sp. KOV_DT_Chl]
MAMATKKHFPLLSSAATIGAMALKNRMVMSPMTTAYCNDDQTPSERLIRYFEERAKGGVGLITMELITIDESHRYMHRSMTLAEDKYIDAHRRITDRIHQHGAKVQPQLSHTGPESVAPLFGGPQPVGPSVSVSPVWGWHSRPLEISELPTIARQYGEGRAGLERRVMMASSYMLPIVTTYWVLFFHRYAINAQMNILPLRRKPVLA